jgi:hypothetical protein
MSEQGYHIEGHQLIEGGPKAERELGPGTVPCVRMFYPHMLSEDAKVWTRFLMINPNAFEQVWYDVHVGRAIEADRRSPEWLQSMADHISRKRIDVVAKKLSNYLIIEIKPVLDMTALGQVLCYSKLFREEFRNRGQVVPMIICDVKGPDVPNVADDYGVDIYCNDFPNENAWFYRPFGMRDDTTTAK